MSETITIVEETSPITVVEEVTNITVVEELNSVSVLTDGVYNFNISGALSPEILTITVNGQTVFTLLNLPTQPHRSQVYLNGVKQTYGVDYMLNTVIFTWLGLSLETSDTFEIYYL